MDNLVSILRMPTLNIEVKNNLLHLIQNWSVAFEGKYVLGYVGQVYGELKSGGTTTSIQSVLIPLRRFQALFFLLKT